jgi:hypothetical protein
MFLRNAGRIGEAKKATPHIQELRDHPHQED